MTALAELNRLPLVQRCAVIGLLVGLAIGAVAGLILGMRAYPPTVWFAVVELGLPATAVGGLVGLLAGSVMVGWRTRHRTTGKP